MAALQKEIRILESGLHDSYNRTSTTTTGAFQIGARGRGLTSASKKKGPVCVFCKGAHPTHTCETVKDYQKRFEIVKRDNLCFNYLAYHKVSQCQSRFRCKKCKKNTTPPCAIVNHHQQNPHVTNQRRETHRVLQTLQDCSHQRHPV